MIRQTYFLVTSVEATRSTLDQEVQSNQFREILISSKVNCLCKLSIDHWSLSHSLIFTTSRLYTQIRNCWVSHVESNLLTEKHATWCPPGRCLSSNERIYELNPYIIGSPLADLSESVVRSVDLCRFQDVNWWPLTNISGEHNCLKVMWNIQILNNQVCIKHSHAGSI